MNATMSRVNGIFNKDLAVRLVLIANNDAIVYLDAATDPYSAATTGAAGAWSQEAQTTLTDVIGEGYWRCFGIGGVFTYYLFRWVKEVLTLRADGVPQGDTFDIDFVHEIGHQLGANHTFHMSWKKLL
jgi:hypothetical protein